MQFQKYFPTSLTFRINVIYVFPFGAYLLSVRHWGYICKQNTEIPVLMGCPPLGEWAHQWTMGNRPVALQPALVQTPTVSLPMALFISRGQRLPLSYLENKPLPLCPA